MEAGLVQSVDIDEQVRTAYLDYAMSVIVARALPDARDGLKPVQRRILYAMHEMGLRHQAPYKKSARIVGEVLGKYHPHGDAAVYEAMARMAQDFSMRYLLVDGQGNFGSVDGDPPAAMRYTEARLTELAEELLADIEKDTVDFVPNFDDSLKEPSVLPSRLPNLLMNGAAGIAVGMATNIPPHNLRELAAAIAYLIERYDQVEEVSLAELLHYVPGPDFPTGGLIVGMEGIEAAYATGHGRLTVRGVAHIEENKNGKYQIVITEIPYQVNKAALIERIAELVREETLDQIADLRDESDRRGMSIVIELKRGAQPQKVLNQLYKFTPLQTTFSVQMLALVDGEPRLLPLKKALQVFIEHRRQVITRRSTFELEKARARLHILDGYLIALAHLDAVIQTIRESADADQARQRLMRTFGLSEAQAQAILDLQLRRLAALERQKIEQEHQQTQAQIAYLEDLLAHPQKVLDLIRTETQELAQKYGDDRRTRIVPEATETLREEDLIHDENVLISITERGYIKRTSVDAFRAQGRGGRGVTAHATRDEDEVVMLLPARTLHTLLFFTDKGKVYSQKVYQIPEADRNGRGVALVNVLALEAGERVTAAVPVADFSAARYCTLATRKGKIKRISLSEFAAVRASGMIAMGLEEGDVLGWACLTRGSDEILLVTEQGKALRFPESAVRPMGRTAAGVQAIRLEEGDAVAGMEIVEPGAQLLIVTEQGFGKRTPLEEYPLQNRAGAGVATIDRKALSNVGKIVAGRVVQPDDDLTLITANGILLRLNVRDVKQAGRATRGVRLITPQTGDSVVSVARLRLEDLKSHVPR
jgi:DNA gyrase subunit A